MKNSATIQSLVESNKIYQLVTDRLDLLPLNESSFSIESDLMNMILELYSSNEEEPIPAEKIQKFSLMQILHYLKASHKMYISKTMPEIEQSMAHIQQRLENDVLNALTLFFNDYKVRFLDHIRMEEKEFFPYLKHLNAAYQGQLNPEDLNNLLANNSIQDFIHEHDAIEDELQNVSKIIHLYANQGEIPLPFKVFLNQVELFELDLRKHAIIEDHILVPLAQNMEKELRNTLMSNK